MEELRQQPLTLLPTPLPEDMPQNEAYFPSSKKQQFLAVIAACLKDLYDVPRAEEIFQRLRRDAKTGASVLTIDTYNAIMLAFAQLQAENSVLDYHLQRQWADKLWNLWDIVEHEEDRVAINETSVAIAFLAHVRAPNDEVDRPSPARLLEIIRDKKLSVLDVLASPVLAARPDHEAVYHLLHGAASEGGHHDIIGVLSGGDQYDSYIGLESHRTNIVVSEVKPVKVTSKALPDGTVTFDTPYNLQSLKTNLEAVLQAPNSTLHSRQVALETSAYDTTIERIKHEMEKLEKLELGAQSKLKHATLQQWMYKWLQATEAKLITDIREWEVMERTGKQTHNNPLDAPITPFLRLLNPSKLAIIAILELMRLHGTGGVAEGMKTSRALIGVGKAVEAECLAEWGKKQRRLANLEGVNVTPRQTGKKVGRKKTTVAADSGLADEGDTSWRPKFSLAGPRTRIPAEVEATPLESDPSAQPVGEVQDLSSGMPQWTQIVRARVGSALVDTLMSSAFVTRTARDENGNLISEEQPAFTHGYEYVRGKKLGVIKLNSVVGERMARDSIRDTLHPRHLPMLVKPQPWEDYNKGGYLTLRSNVMRVKDSLEQLSYLKHASAAGHVDLVFECLDALGETPWRINEKILKVVLEVWNQGKGMAGIPPAQVEDEEPVKPDNYDTDPRARATYLLRMKDLLNAKRNNHGERCHVNYKLEVARAFINDDFYMPHNVDFRGRAYPIPPHLNHIGDDLSRGLLLFAERRPLGESGLRWLKIHLSNVFGYDKASFDERHKFVEDHIEDVMDSANNPLDGKQWWLKADDPWQCLATCMELTAALSSKTIPPELYESSLPVHQDGTCNGLQHYAALGGDTVGAQHVNLQYGARPADVYSHVARMVEEVVAKDALEGDEIAQMIRGKITRKVVKQTVMTTVYGVTFIGAREQIEKQLRDAVGLSREESWPVAAYLAKQVLGCIGDLFSGASQIQNWLSTSARLIAKSIPPDRIGNITGPKDAARERMTSVIWTTALGLPIVQPYRKAKKKQIMTALQTVFISDPNLPTVVDPVKQAAAFPPNFVHSLDATHMMLTALECRAASITFASVHDSYWTHASTVKEMSAIIRDTFIALHSSDILTKLREEFMDRYAGYRVPLSTLTDRELCSVLKNLARPDHNAPPGLLSLIVALVKRSASRYAKEESTKQALIAAREKLSQSELEAALESVENASEVPEEQDSGEGATAEDESVEDLVEDVEGEPKRAKRKPAAKRTRVVPAKLDPELQYIELTTILPYLPEKGTFDVNDIKTSQYFFS